MNKVNWCSNQAHIPKSYLSYRSWQLTFAHICEIQGHDKPGKAWDLSEDMDTNERILSDSTPVMLPQLFLLEVMLSALDRQGHHGNDQLSDVPRPNLL